MKRILVVGSAAFAVAIGLTGCFGSSGNSSDQQAGEADQGPAWKLELRNQCAQSASEQCVGFYGFTVTADGKFIVGPGPSGQTLTGSLNAQEYKSLEDAYLAALPGSTSLAAKPNICHKADSEELTDSIALERQGQKNALISNANSELCFQSANFDAAKALHDEIWNLANKYYALPFPDACEDSARTLEALYPALQSCSTDADCTYVGLDFQPIPAGSNLYVTTQSGTKAQPLIVANLKKLNSSLSQLQQDADTAAAACDGTEMYATDGFYPGGVAPVCAQGTCHIPQSVNHGT